MRFYLWCLLLLSPGCLYGWNPYKTDPTQQAVSPISDGLDHLEPVDRKIPEGPYLVEFIREPAKGDQYTHLTVSRDRASGKFYLHTWSEWKTPNMARPVNEVLGPSVRIELPEDMAASIYSMWINELLETRYDRESHAGQDGWLDIFTGSIHSRGWLHGCTWNPTKDLPPKWMDDSANALLQFAKDKDETKCRSTLTDLRDKLFAYLVNSGKS
jgi:hypothetical protein